MVSFSPFKHDSGRRIIHLEEQSVARLLLDSLLDTLSVGDSQVITNNLDLVVDVEVGPRLKVVLVKGVLDRADVVLLHIALVHLGELGTGEPLRLVGLGVLYISETSLPIRQGVR